MEVFLEISAVIALATGVSVVMRILRQPLIVGYILTGILSGSYFLDILHSVEVIELFSKLGITILLFIVGLHLNPQVIKEVGKVSLITGIGQVLFTSLIGFGIAIALGLPRLAALYTSIALTFSSTIIILKLLSDKGDLNRLYGKISIGFLLVQDIVATIILIIVTSLSFSSGSENSTFEVVLFTIGKGFLLIGGVLIFSSMFLTRICRYIAKSQELLYIFSVAWGLGLGSVFTLVGFSVEIGALVAGVALSSTPYANEIGTRLKPLRDFFIVLFFILLGSQMQLSNLADLIVPALLLSFFVLIGNPLIVVILMNLLGYNRRTGFMAGLTVAQISEFSLILATLGFQVGHVSQEVLSLITLVGLITIAGSTYLIMYAERIYPYISRSLQFVELNKKIRNKRDKDEKGPEAILFGYDRVGEDFLHAFKKLELRYVVVDYNPQAIAKMQERGIPCKYGDAEDIEFLTELGLESVKICVSTLPTFQSNVFVLEKAREVNKKSVIIGISHHANEAKELYLKGATYVITPHYLGARYASNMIIRNGVKRQEYEKERGRHLEHIYKKYLLR